MNYEDEFDPRVSEYDYSLPSQRQPGLKDTRGDDYQIYTPTGTTGSGWTGTTTTYEVKDARGNPTGQIAVRDSLGNRQLLKDAVSYAGTAAGLGAFGELGSTLGKIGQTINAAASGNIPGAVAGAAGLGGYEGLANTANFIGAAQAGDPFSAALSGMNLAGVKDFNIGGFNIDQKDIANLGGFTRALESGDPAALLTFAGKLADSPTMESVGRFGSVLTAAQTGNPTAIFNAARQTYGALSNMFAGPPQDDTDYAALYAEPSYLPGYQDPDGFWVQPEQIEQAKPEDYNVQDLDISQGNIDRYNKNLSDMMKTGGYASTWQRIGRDRVMVQEDGTAVGINTETGDTYSLTADEVTRLIDGGVLNTNQSGYTEAITGSPAPAPSPSPAPAPAPAPAASRAPAPSPAPAPAAGGSQGGGLSSLLPLLMAAMMDKKDEQKREPNVANIEVESPFGSIYD